MGVWIETTIDYFMHLFRYVTPFVGVWIETKKAAKYQLQAASHPSWVCGLKLAIKPHQTYWSESHPSWVCGLKQLMRSQEISKFNVTPFVGVWIET